MYGTSLPTGKEEVGEFVRPYLHPKDKILDVGAGGGIYRRLLGADYEWTGIDVWPGAISHIDSIYDHTILGDIRNFVYEKNYDLVIFGDVLEHLSVEDAQKVLAEASLHSHYILVAVPFLYVQGAIYNNEAERHLQDDLTHDVFNRRYPGFTPIFLSRTYAYYWKEIKS